MLLLRYTGNDRFSGNDRYSGLQGPDFFPLYTSFTVLDSFLSCYQSHLTLVQLLMHCITCCDGGGIGGCDIENRGGGGGIQGTGLAPFDPVHAYFLNDETFR